MLAKYFFRFCLVFGVNAKDGCSNFGSLLMGVGAIGLYLFGKQVISMEQLTWFGLCPLLGGGLIGWATSRADDLGLRDK
jgi:Na+/proline symporter